MTAATAAALRLAGRLRGLRVLTRLALVRCLGLGLVGGLLVPRARPTARGVARDRAGHVPIEALLSRLRVRAGALLVLADLEAVLLLPIAAAPRFFFSLTPRLRGPPLFPDRAPFR